MDLSSLDQSSGVTPLLVRLYDDQKQYGNASEKRPQLKAQLIAAISQLFSMDLSTREMELVADVLISLMAQAEKDLRHALAEQLSVIDNIPIRVVLQVASDAIDIAAPMIRNSTVLKDSDLLYLIKSKNAEYWRAIAARQSLSGQVVDMLADTKDFGTALALAENKSITLTEHALVVLSDMAQGHDVLAAPLIRRSEITSSIASKLYRLAGKEIKQQIVENFEMDTGTLIDTVDDVVLEFVESAEIGEFMPTQAMLKSAERFQEKGLLTINLILGTLRRGQIAMFVAQFSKFTGLSPETVTDILLQPTGQGLAVACKAFEIVKPDFTSIYLLTNRVRSEGRMIDMKDLNRALSYFDTIRKEIALDIMKNSGEKK